MKNLKYLVLAGAAVIVGFMAVSASAGSFGSFSNDPSSNITGGAEQKYFITVSTPTDGAAARDMIDKMGEKAISFLSDDSLSQDQKEDRFRELLRAHFDMPTIGRFALGNNWKNANPEQQKEYQKLFEALVVEVYAARFNDYQGQKFEVSSFRDTGKQDVVVTSYIVPDTGSKVQVDWRVRNRNGQYKIVDVIIEGVSMTVTQRSDFSSVIQRGGGNIEVLLDHLRK